MAARISAGTGKAGALMNDLTGLGRRIEHDPRIEKTEAPDEKCGD